MKVGFILNHYDLHQVPHIVPYAFELSRCFGHIETVVFGSTEDELGFAEEIGQGYQGHRCSFQPLRVPSFIKILDPLLSKAIFARKSVVLKANADLLRQCDALIVPEMTSLGLRTLPGFENVKLIRTGHGAGDNRQVGAFNNRIDKFDLVLLPGRKYVDGLREVGYLSAGHWAISGYPKFEAIDRLGIGKRTFFDNDKPTVIYNPHHPPRLSSWKHMGRHILDFFYGNADYNLIFAPHVILFKRPWGRGVRLPKKYTSNNGVLIDTSSRNSVDMTYIKSADIYLGDTSSQIYEFLYQPRPCVFLNAHNVVWRNNPEYRHWGFGPVIDDIADLQAALEEATKSHAQYEDIQRRAFAYTFETGNQPAAVRGAHIIADYLRTGRIDAKWQ